MDLLKRLSVPIAASVILGCASFNNSMTVAKRHTYEPSEILRILGAENESEIVQFPPDNREYTLKSSTLESLFSKYTGMRTLLFTRRTTRLLWTLDTNGDKMITDKEAGNYDN